jgi:muramoyltetrapeptide carboxypeptidase
MKHTLFLILLTCSCTILWADNPQIFPPALKKGDLIALVFPASYVESDDDSAVLKKRALWLKNKGYRSSFYPTTVTTYGYLAGTDKERAAALMDAWKNPEVKAIWCFRGGYGTPRLLDLLDYDWIKTHPKILIGMSDITALHNAIHMKTGLVTFLGPVLNYFATDNDSFDDTYALAQLEPTLTVAKPRKIDLPTSGLDLKVLKPGKAQGKFVGGNLSLIAALCGTPWQLETKGKILVLEDVGEKAYRIDRLLWQLEEASLLDSPAAVILGGWEACSSTNNVTLEQVFKEYFGNKTYPVILNFPTGHIKYQATIPLNVLGEVDTEKKKISILEPSVQPNSIDDLIKNHIFQKKP